MSLYTIYTYTNVDQLREIQRQNDVVPFVFGDTKDVLEYSPDICLDISSLIYLLRANKENMYASYVNLRGL